VRKENNAAYPVGLMAACAPVTELESAYVEGGGGRGMGGSGERGGRPGGGRGGWEGGVAGGGEGWGRGEGGGGRGDVGRVGGGRREREGSRVGRERGGGGRGGGGGGEEGGGRRGCGMWVDGQVKRMASGCMCLCMCVHMGRCDWTQLGVFECMCLFPCTCALGVDPFASASLVISLQILSYAQHFFAQASCFTQYGWCASWLLTFRENAL
jgi:hypothetical protein